MNIAYPKSGFDTPHFVLQEFAKLLQGGFENPELVSGRVKCTVLDDPELGFVADIGDTLDIKFWELDGRFDTEIKIPANTLDRIFREFEYLDFRDPEITGTIEMSGDLSLSYFLSKTCLRPTDFTLGRFEQVERLHRRLDYKNLSSVEVIEDPSQQEILKYIKESKPVVIAGLKSDQPKKDWTLEGLVQAYGDAEVRVLSAEHRQTMKEFVEELKEFERSPHNEFAEGYGKPYTEGARLPKEMWNDFGPLFFSREDYTPPQLWLGTVPTHVPSTSLHRDPRTGFLFQVIGKKRLELYSADQAEYLYPMKSYNNYQQCWFRPDLENYERYPKARNAKSLSITLEPGQLFIQPAGWFHQVYAEDSPNMSVSHFWRY